jgi:hypothetical protein
VRDYNRIARPLTNLIKTGIFFNFNKACLKAFKKLKHRLISSEILRYFDSSLPSRLETDISNEVIAGVLSQLYENGEWYPVIYFSKTMQGAEYNYKIYNKEMLAVIRSLEN